MSKLLVAYTGPRKPCRTKGEKYARKLRREGRRKGIIIGAVAVALLALPLIWLM